MSGQGELMTALLFRDDAYLQRCDARVLSVRDDGSVVLDRTVFYAASGGQPGDTGILATDGGAAAVCDAVYLDEAKTEIAHRLGSGGPSVETGAMVAAAIDWPPRHARMRMHTALHLLSAVLPYPVTGGSIGADESRLDFDIPDPNLDRDAITERLNAFIAADHPVTGEWISDQELLDNPGLVKTMAVKPPIGSGRVRLIRIGTPGAIVDLQPCGGTHVRSTGEIGDVEIARIEKKGKINRRVRLRFGGAGRG